MRWCLARFGKKNVATVRELTESELEEYDGADELLRTFWGDQELFALVLLNFEDYQDNHKRIVEHLTSAGPVAGDHGRSAMLHINLRILNYLASVRSFLDHTEANLKRRHGEDSVEVSSFKSACSREYDTYFSYRFLYQLRNYVQHLGLPVGSVSGSARARDADFKEVERSVSISFERGSLLDRSFEWKPTVRQELLDLPDLFPIHPHMVQMMQCLQRIHMTLIGEGFPTLVDAALFIDSLASSIGEGEGTAGLFKMEEPGEPGESVEFRIRRMPFYAVEMVAMLATPAVTE